MDKLKLHTPDFTEANIAKIAELFPNCVTEAKDDQGNIKKAIDFDQLRQELSDHVVDGPRERYHLNWPGKRAALLAANAPIAMTLRPSRKESVDFDTTKNLFIEGDNLDALKLLQETYLNKVKMIYIDPPYNTGKDFLYDDNFAEDSSNYFERSQQHDEDGRRLVANSETNGRFHSDWLSMMYSRLRLARTLLADDGVLFVSIDDHELDNLLKICDEVFGADNFIAAIGVQVNPRGRHLDRFIAKTHECIAVFTKSNTNPHALAGLTKSGRMLDEYDKEDGIGKYRLLGLRNRNQAFNPSTRPNLYYPLYVDSAGKTVSTLKSQQHLDEVLPITTDGVKTCWTWGKEKVEREGSILIAEKTAGEWRIYRKDYLDGEDGSTATTMPKSLWTDKEFNNDYGRKVLKELFGQSLMDFPKSVQLLEQIVRIGCSDSGIVMDFFAGSATTAQAVMTVNATDGIERSHIMVQLPEECKADSSAMQAGFATIAELAKERIRRAGKKIKEEAGLNGQKLDIGFRVLKVDSSNMKDVYYTPDAVDQLRLLGDVDNIKDDRTDEDLLFQVLLDWGVDLTLPITAEPIGGKNVYFVDDNALAACFEPGIDEAFIKELANRKPLRVVFRDIGYGSDATKINVEQIFKLISPTTEVKSI